jgi:hypothetical protein
MGGERPDAHKARKALAASRKELERLGCFQALSIFLRGKQLVVENENKPVSDLSPKP